MGTSWSSRTFMFNFHRKITVNLRETALRRDLGVEDAKN
jgi:hypothetical protein